VRGGGKKKRWRAPGADPAPGEAGAGQVKRSDPDDVAGLWALGAIDDFELDVLALFE
jgi:hypothetical protein